MDVLGMYRNIFSINDTIQHVFMLHDEFVNVKPSYYIKKLHSCKKCSYYTQENNEFIKHWKEYHQ